MPKPTWMFREGTQVLGNCFRLHGFIRFLIKSLKTARPRKTQPFKVQRGDNNKQYKVGASIHLRETRLESTGVILDSRPFTNYARTLGSLAKQQGERNGSRSGNLHLHIQQLEKSYRANVNELGSPEPTQGQVPAYPSFSTLTE